MLLPPTATKDTSIVGTAVAAGQFKTLAAALSAAGLTETLSTGGPYTVFAPTDEAFKKLPPATLATLLTPAGKDQLKKILLNHVVAGKVEAKDVVKITSAKTLAGTDLAVSSKEDGTVHIGAAKVVTADVAASNGVIHVIDTVLLPAE